MKFVHALYSMSLSSVAIQYGCECHVKLEIMGAGYASWGSDNPLATPNVSYCYLFQKSKKLVPVYYSLQLSGFSTATNGFIHFVVRVTEWYLGLYFYDNYRDSWPWTRSHRLARYTGELITT